jgi:hypothetical protein
MGGIKQNPRLHNFMNDDTPRTNAQLLSSDCAYNCGHHFSLRRAQKWVNGKCVESRENVAHGNDDVVVLADFARELERENAYLRSRLKKARDLTLTHADRFPNFFAQHMKDWVELTAPFFDDPR